MFNPLQIYTVNVTVQSSSCTVYTLHWSGIEAWLVYMQYL